MVSAVVESVALVGVDYVALVAVAVDYVALVAVTVYYVTLVAVDSVALVAVDSVALVAVTVDSVALVAVDTVALVAVEVESVALVAVAGRGAGSCCQLSQAQWSSIATTTTGHNTAWLTYTTAHTWYTAHTCRKQNTR